MITINHGKGNSEYTLITLISWQLYQKELPKGNTKRIDQGTDHTQVMKHPIPTNNKCTIHDKNINTVPYEEIFEKYNSICSNLPKITLLTESRKKKIRIRWLEISSIEKIEEIFKRANKTRFPTGSGKNGWRCTFDWIFANDRNWLKG